MATRTFPAWFLAAAITALGGCSTLRAPASVDAETATQRFGPYCEQLGNLKGTPEYAACVRQTSTTYQ